MKMSEKSLSVSNLQQQLIEKTAQSMVICMEISKIRKQLTPICDHSQTEVYDWEHDNGYGRQTKMIGTRCIFCFKKDYWNRGQWTDL